MRIVFEYQPSPGRPPTNWRDQVPPTFSLVQIDKALASQLQNDLVASGNPPWFETVWGSIENFLDKGFGFVVLHDGGIVCNCRTYRVEDKIAAIQVSTRFKHRQQGLATLACSAFLEHCQAAGIIPEYSCVEENTPSAALAKKLGFIPVGLREEDPTDANRPE